MVLMLILCVWEFCLQIFLFTKYMLHLQRPEEGDGSLELEL